MGRKGPFCTEAGRSKGAAGAGDANVWRNQEETEDASEQNPPASPMMPDHSELLLIDSWGS